MFKYRLLFHHISSFTLLRHYDAIKNVHMIQKGVRCKKDTRKFSSYIQWHPGHGCQNLLTKNSILISATFLVAGGVGASNFLKHHRFFLQCS